MSAAANTKVELVTEAIEALVLATVINVQAAHPRSHDEVTNDVLRRALEIRDAREGVAAALRELLTPTLRVMTNTPQREVIAAPDARPAYPTA